LTGESDWLNNLLKKLSVGGSSSFEVSQAVQLK